MNEKNPAISGTKIALEISIVLPCLNEERTIGNRLEGFKGEGDKIWN